MVSWILTKIKEERWILLFLALLGIIRAYWHVSWFRPNWTWLPIWDYPFGIKSPPFDTFHTVGGFFALTLIAGLRMNLRTIPKGRTIINRKNNQGDYIGITEIDTGITVIRNKWWENCLIIGFEFIWFFWFFTMFYHVIFMTAEHQEWSKAIFFLKYFGL